MIDPYEYKFHKYKSKYYDVLTGGSKGEWKTSGGTPKKESSLSMSKGPAAANVYLHRNGSLIAQLTLD